MPDVCGKFNIKENEKYLKSIDLIVIELFFFIIIYSVQYYWCITNAQGWSLFDLLNTIPSNFSLKIISKGYKFCKVLFEKILIQLRNF